MPLRSEVPEEHPSSMVQVNLKDFKQLRHSLDDKVLKLIEEAGYVPDHWMSNTKIGLGLAAIGVAVLSHVVPVPFPANRPMLFVCAVLYAICSGVMQLLMSYVEKDTLFLSLPNSKGQRLRLQTFMTNFAAEYKVVVEVLSPHQHPGSIPEHIHAFTTKKTLCIGQHTASIGQFFDDRGVLYTPGVKKVAVAENCTFAEQRQASQQIISSLFSGYDYGRLPAQPIDVSLSATVAKINEIRTSEQTVHLNMFMRHGWTDTRLTWNATEHCGVEMIMLRPEDLIWRPDSFFANSNEIKSPDGEEYTKLWHDGFILWSKRMVLTIFCDMSFRHFPFDSQECVSVLESYGYPTTDLVYSLFEKEMVDREEVPFGFSMSLTSSGAYRLLSPEVTVVPPASYSGVEFSKVEFKYKFERNRSRYIVSMFIPLLLVVSISFVGLWIDAGSIPARTAIAATTLLMLVTLMYTLTKELPTTVYLTSLDYYFIICFLFLFFNACEYALVNYLTTRHAKLESDIGKRRAQRAKLRGPRDALMVEGGPAEVQHRKQRAELKEVFKLYDHSKTGSITTQDLGSLLLAFAEDRGCDLSVEEVQEWVYQCDTDQSGTIEFDELCNFAETHLDTFMNQEEARALLICGSFPVTRRSIITIERRYRILSPCLFMAATRMRLLGTI